MKSLFLFVFSLIIAGCGTGFSTPLKARSFDVILDVPLLSVDMGGSAKVFLNVADERPEKTPAPSAKYETVAPIIPAGDLTGALGEALGKRLVALGYDVLREEDRTAARLIVAVRTLEYGRYSTKPQRLHIDASLFSAVYRGETPNFEKTYARNYMQVGKATDMEQTWFEEKSNRLLSELVEKMLADLELHAALLQ